MKADQLNRARAHQPLGPASSINRGPVQGQPRIFASMNTGADFQQEPPALRQGQPRIFAAGNGQDPRPRSINGQPPSPGYTRRGQPQQEPPALYNNRTGDITGKGMDRSAVDPMQGLQQPQQSERPFDQRESQTLPHNQTGEPLVRNVYTEAMSPAMQYRATLARGERNRVVGSGAPENRSTEPQSPLRSTHRPPARRTTEPHFEPPPPAPLRQNSAGSNNEPQQRFAGSGSQPVEHQQTLNLNGDNVNYKLNRHQSLYSPAVTIKASVPDTQLLNEPPIPSPKTVRGFAQRSDSAKRESGRYHSPPTPISFNTENSPPATNGYSGGEINGSNQETLRNRDPRRQSVGRNVQGSTGSLSTQDPSRKTSLTSNTSVSSERERDRSPAVVEPQPVRNRLRKTTQPLRWDNGQSLPPPTHLSQERTRTNAAPTNRGSQMDSFYGGDASLSGMKKLSPRSGEEANRTDVDEEPEPYFYPLELHLLHPQLLGAILQYLSFYDWCTLQGTNKNLRSQLGHIRELKEEILERYLSTIGYARWIWEEDEPLQISLRVKSSCLSPMIFLTSMCRILASTCVVFRYQHTSTPESQRATCKRELPVYRKRRK